MSTHAPVWPAPDAAILRTVLYASLFEYPLTLDELRRTLLCSSMTEQEILRTYRGSPRLQALIEHREGLFLPRGRQAWIAQRRRREIRSLAFLRRHRLLLSVIAALPFVRLVALSGSVAVLNADRHADLDLFVITKGRRAWMITLAIVVLSKLTRRRRVVCLNFVMSDDRLTLDQQDLFSANQTIQLRPIAGRETYLEFLAANPFVRRFYPNFDPATVQSPFVAEPGLVRQTLKTLVEMALALPSYIAEAASRKAYAWHLRRRAASWESPDQVRLLPSCLKLHTRSHRHSVVERFETLCDEALAVERWKAS